MSSDSEESDLNDKMHSKTPVDSQFLCGVVEGFYGRPWTTDQRKELFVNMNKFGMNAYLYAPKDDCKHRAFWRDLYSVEEAEQLRGVIDAAKERNVIFFYALSPGLDITFSSQKEMGCLKRKLEQVSQLGCNAFALLFDDIEADMCEADKEIFQSFAHAQVSVTNEVYQHLNQPRFLFCPTEYCSSRAVPTVLNSEYLSTVGAKLLPGVDFMWTGSKVITKCITRKLIDELQSVIKRQPVIWDNLHANDYDQRRLYLGPYSGRSPDIIPSLRGVMTNPNCEFDVNYIAFHTLGQWSRCNVDGKRDLGPNDSVSCDIRLETESESGSIEDIPSSMGPQSYHPRKALLAALMDWLPEFDIPKVASGRGIAVKPQLPLFLPPPIINTCLAIASTIPTITGSGSTTNATMTTTLVPSKGVSSGDFGNKKDSDGQNGIADSKPKSDLEFMDCDSTPSCSLKELKVVDITPTIGDPLPPQNGVESMVTDDIDDDLFNKSAGDEAMPVDSVDASKPLSPPSDFRDSFQSKAVITDVNKLTIENLITLADLFYLPFEHGSQGVVFLQEFQWLKMNAYRITRPKCSKNNLDKTEVEEWHKRAAKFNDMTEAAKKLNTNLSLCKNRALVYDLYPYVWDAVGAINLLNSYVKWLALGCYNIKEMPANSQERVPNPNNNSTWFTHGWKEAFLSGEQEPWVFRGGITSELQKLLLLDNSFDLFVWRPPDAPVSMTYTIRPYLNADRLGLYEICYKSNFPEDIGSLDLELQEHTNLVECVGDRLLSGYLDFSGEYCFVVEDEHGLCGYALAALDAKQFHTRLQIAWLPELQAKYPYNGGSGEEVKQNGSFRINQEIGKLHAWKPNVVNDVYKNHDSILNVVVSRTLPVDGNTTKSLLACVIAALKANGSSGLYCELQSTNLEGIDFYKKLGFIEIAVSDRLPEDTCVYLGRTY